MNGEQIKHVRDVMTDDFILVDGLATVSEAVAAMKEAGARVIIVRKRHRYDEYGILMLSDIAKQVVARNRSPDRVNVYEIMAKPVISVRPEMGIRYCARLFERVGISHAPVIKDETVVGIVSYYLLVLGSVELN